MNRKMARAMIAVLSASLIGAPVFAKGQDERGGPPAHAKGQKGQAGNGHDKGAHRRARGWHRGDVVPEAYRGGGYVVADWRAAKLKVPPPGHRWIKVDGDYVLVAIATGVIVSILLGD